MVTSVVLVTFASRAIAQDRFALAIGAHDNLVILGPKGERFEVTVPTISKSVIIGATSFQVSFGRDANDLLTAIIAPDPGQPQDLHFDVLRKSIDASKQSVVTLTFPTANRVVVDPGFTGSVEVNSRGIRHHDLEAQAAPPPAPVAPEPIKPRATVALEPAPVPAPPPPRVVESTPEPVSSPKPVVRVTTEEKPAASPMPDPAPQADSSPTATNLPINSPPLMGAIIAQPPPASPVPTAGTAAASSQKLFWSEPITPPDGQGPTVSSTQMKLVEVQGPVSVRLVSGDTRTAENGMILPSGATVLTSGESSAAVFMGGVNSVRLLPDTEARVSQKLDGSVRHTSIDLVQGTIFNRVGRRPGETQDYQVKTPEGVAAARGTDYADHRGRGKDGKFHHYVFVAKGVVDCFVAGLTYKVVAGSSSSLGSAAMPPADDVLDILHAILVTLQPYDLKLAGVLARINNGTATAGDQAFYNALVDTYFGEVLPGIIDNAPGGPVDIRKVIPAARRALNQILEPFGTVPLSPY